MGLFLPRRFNSQPSFPARLRRNPYPTFVFCPSFRVEPVTGDLLKPGSSATFGPGLYGVELKGSGAAGSFVELASPYTTANFMNYMSRDFSATYDPTLPWYVFFRVYISVTGTSQQFLSDGNANFQYDVNFYNRLGNWRLETANGATTTVAGAGSVTLGWHTAEIWSTGGATGYTQFLSIDGGNAFSTVNPNPLVRLTDPNKLHIAGSGIASPNFNPFRGTLPLVFGLNFIPSAAQRARYRQNPWGELFVPEDAPNFYPLAGGGPIVKVGSAAAEAGGVARASGVGASVGTAKAAGGGNAAASGKGDSVGTAKAGAGGNAKATGVSVSVGTAKSVGGGVARGFGTGSGVITGTGAAEGGAAATAAGTTSKSGVGRSVGGGVAKAVGGVPPPPGIVDHYVKGWPVSASGAVIVHLVP